MIAPPSLQSTKTLPSTIEAPLLAFADEGKKGRNSLYLVDSNNCLLFLYSISSYFCHYMLTLCVIKQCHILSESIFCFRTLNLDAPVLADEVPFLHKDCNFDVKLDSDLMEIQED